MGKANELLEAIRIEREDIESRPILFLGHSMGGLLIKQALINEHNNLKYTPIKDATTWLAFGTWKKSPRTRFSRILSMYLTICF